MAQHYLFRGPISSARINLTKQELTVDSDLEANIEANYTVSRLQTQAGNSSCSFDIRHYNSCKDASWLLYQQLLLEELFGLVL